MTRPAFKIPPRLILNGSKQGGLIAGVLFGADKVTEGTFYQFVSCPENFECHQIYYQEVHNRRPTDSHFIQTTGLNSGGLTLCLQDVVYLLDGGFSRRPLSGWENLSSQEA